MDDDPEDDYNVEENFYAFLNIPKTVSGVIQQPFGT